MPFKILLLSCTLYVSSSYACFGPCPPPAPQPKAGEEFLGSRNFLVPADFDCRGIADTDPRLDAYYADAQIEAKESAVGFCGRGGLQATQLSSFQNFVICHGDAGSFTMDVHVNAKYRCE